MPQLRVTQLCNNNEKLKKFTFFPFSEEIKLQQKAHTFHNNMLHIWEDNDTLFTQNSCKLPAQHNYKWCSPSKLKISIEMKEPDREKRVRSYRRVESLMEPFRWACNSTFGIDANHSIFVCGILFFFSFFPTRLFMDLISVLDFVVCFSYWKLEIKIIFCCDSEGWLALGVWHSFLWPNGQRIKLWIMGQKQKLLVCFRIQSPYHDDFVFLRYLQQFSIT